MYAVQAEGAIEIARLLWRKQIQLAASLPLVAANAIKCVTTPACFCIAHSHFIWRNERIDEIKLPDRAHIFAKACATEQAVDNKRRHKISNDDPRRHTGFVPKAECLISPQIDCNEPRCHPL